MIAKPLKPKKCASCKRMFTPMRPMARACSVHCAQQVAESKRAREIAKLTKLDRKQTRERLAKFKTKAQYIAEAQRETNRYIRLRDKGLPCICCGRLPKADDLGGGAFDAGHFRSRGAASHLRFDERNIHAQLKHCNRYSFDVAAYRRGLIERIGLAEVESLESDNAPRKWTIPELQEIKRIYKARADQLQKEKE